MSKMWERTDFWPVERMANAPIDDYVRGLADGRQTVEAELSAERQALLQLATALDALQPPSNVLVASLIVVVVERLVRDIAGHAPIDGTLLRERADALAAVVANDGQIILAVHPEDVSLLEGGAAVVGDPALDRGTVEARTSNAVHEDGVIPALDRLRAEIARLGLLS